MNDATLMADRATYDRAVQHFGQRRIALPTFAELAEPQRIGAARVEGLKSVDADAAEGLNLFRVHWYNDAARSGLAQLPAHVVLPETLTGVASPI
ncbi:MAG TPA: pyridoxal-5'-phosphate-dependent protein subunit beta, partial [Rubrivivax sp.]|nr:pyridoxal-5'-phosphate-dependent protein subunit beta [Rubrivivax sp.]